MKIPLFSASDKTSGDAGKTDWICIYGNYLLDFSRNKKEGLLTDGWIRHDRTVLNNENLFNVFERTEHRHQQSASSRAGQQI